MFSDRVAGRESTFENGEEGRAGIGSGGLWVAG